jgi:carbonic anhydrase/acetyltransferase-like protein (isoleucine patch superfamily)
VLQANLLSIQVRWVDQVITRPIWAAGLALRALLPWPGSGGLIGRITRLANRVGKRVQIHPSALVEGSFIDDGAVIGPRAIVRGSIIGKGATVEQAADVSFSVIGPGSFVSKHSILWAVAAMESSDLCMKGMQMCLVGRRAALTARASPIDLSPGHKIRVLDGDRLVEIDLPLLGSCYGHDTFIGADVFVGPGRAIPNGIRVVPPPERVLSRIPTTEPGKSYFVKDGTLEELK